MNVHVKPTSDLVNMSEDARRRRLVRAAIYELVARNEVQRKELVRIGVALTEEFISPGMAIELLDEVAPGCLDDILPFSARGAAND